MFIVVQVGLKVENRVNAPVFVVIRDVVLR